MKLIAYLFGLIKSQIASERPVRDVARIKATTPSPPVAAIAPYVPECHKGLFGNGGSHRFEVFSMMDGVETCLYCGKDRECVPVMNQMPAYGARF